MISFFVPGVPRPQGSKRAIRLRTGRTVLVESSKDLGWWRETVRLRAKQEMDATKSAGWFGRQALSVSCVFYLFRPKSAKKDVTFPTTYPDLDKLIRAVFDACSAVSWRDDSQVVNILASKRFCGDMGPGVSVVIEETTF